MKQRFEDSRKDMSHELVQSIFSILEEYQNHVRDSLFSEEEAKNLSLEIVRNIRYGDYGKDYYWIHDTNYNILSHPYYPPKYMGDYQSSEGSYPIVEMTKLALSQGEGFVSYDWQWKDDPTRISKKTSYVKYFKPWGWIIGTGFYDEEIDFQVKEQIRQVLWVSLLLLFVFIGVIAILLGRGFRNLRDLYKNRDKLEESERRFRSMAQNIMHGLTIKENEKVVYVNSRFCEIYQIESETALTFDPYAYIESEDPNNIRQLEIQGRKKLDHALQLSFWVKLTDGSRKYLLNKYSFEQREGKIYTYVVTTDFTEYIKIELELTKLSKTILQSPASIIITDLEGKIEFVNEHTVLVTGYKAEELIGQPSSIFKSGKMPQSIYSDLWSTINKGHVWENELLNKKKDGELIWESAAIFPIKNDEDVIINYAAVKLDIGRRKKMEDELFIAKDRAESGERLKTAFLQNVSHEVRTPLNAVLGFAQILRNDLREHETLHRYAQLIESNAKILTKLFSDIIDYSTIESGNVVFRNTPIDVSVLLSKLVSKYNVMNTTQFHKKVELLIDDEALEGHNVIQADKKYLTQILDHLLSNAMKFTEEGFVRIGYVVSEKEIVFQVADTGSGIPEEEHQTIFNSFSHGSSVFLTLHRGTGLGLNITKRLVDFMNGRIWFESEEKKGSVFYVALPLLEVAELKAASNVLPYKIEKLRSLLEARPILVAEDNNTNYKLIEAILYPLRPIIVRARNGNEAIDIIDKRKDITLVLMDIMMPEMDGVNAAQIIHRVNPTLPIMAISAIDEDKVEKSESIFNAYLHKPFTKESFYTLLSQMLS